MGTKPLISQFRDHELLPEIRPITISSISVNTESLSNCSMMKRCRHMAESYFLLTFCSFRQTKELFFFLLPMQIWISQIKNLEQLLSWAPAMTICFGEFWQKWKQFSVYILQINAWLDRTDWIKDGVIHKENKRSGLHLFFLPWISVSGNEVMNIVGCTQVINEPICSKVFCITKHLSLRFQSKMQSSHYFHLHYVKHIWQFVIIYCSFMTRLSVRLKVLEKVWVSLPCVWFPVIWFHIICVNALLGEIK